MGQWVSDITKALFNKERRKTNTRGTNFSNGEFADRQETHQVLLEEISKDNLTKHGTFCVKINTKKTSQNLIKTLLFVWYRNTVFWEELYHETNLTCQIMCFKYHVIQWRRLKPNFLSTSFKTGQIPPSTTRVSGSTRNSQFNHFINLLQTSVALTLSLESFIIELLIQHKQRQILPPVWFSIFSCDHRLLFRLRCSLIVGSQLELGRQREGSETRTASPD